LFILFLKFLKNYREERINKITSSTEVPTGHNNAQTLLVENGRKHHKGKQVKQTRTDRSNKRKKEIQRELLADKEAGKKNKEGKIKN
jgi:hypothetical protein